MDMCRISLFGLPKLLLQTTHVYIFLSTLAFFAGGSLFSSGMASGKRHSAEVMLVEACVYEGSAPEASTGGGWEPAKFTEFSRLSAGGGLVALTPSTASAGGSRVRGGKGSVVGTGLSVLSPNSTKRW